MNTCRLLCCVALAVVHLGVATAQPVRWEVDNGGNGHFYEVFQGPADSFFGGIQHVITWSNAFAQAQARGGYWRRSLLLKRTNLCLA